MFKLGRGGGGGSAGRGNGKRPLGPPPSSSALRRPSPAAPRNSSVGRNRPPASASSATATAMDESFRLESDGPLDFGAIIRLTPDLVDEIRRVESRGGAARIKFDSSLNNQTGNVIDVGGKEFKFTWSRELGDLCDIYEERQSGEDGNGLLVECGSSWRKLNVHRILDESTKNHVKMRSEEAERLSKSRKAIVLDPTNPSVKNQAKSMAAAAVEGNMRRMGWKNKKEFFKNRNVESNQASSISQPKSVPKTGSSIKNSKGRPSLSPNPSPPEQNPRGTSTSPFGIETLFGDDSSYDPITPSNLNREDARKSDKDTPSRGINTVQNDTSGHAVGNGEQLEKLRSMLISTLSDNPKGMSFKDLEKMIGGTIPNCSKKLHSIIKEVAVSGASGTYLLKPHLRKVPETESSPDCLDEHVAVAEIVRPENNNSVKFQHQASSSVNPDWFEKIDMAHNNEEPFSAEGKSNNDSEARARSSSDSGSDSDSDSSDSGSDSGSQSRSKSKSPVGSSSSDSDSDSDGSSSSKEGSDVDVDILSDDEKDTLAHKVVAPEPNTSPLPTLSKYDHEQNNFTEDQHMHVSPSPIDQNDFQYHEGGNVTVETSHELSESRENNAFENPVMVDIYNKTSRIPKAASFRSPNPERQLETQQYHSANDTNERIPKSSFSSKPSILNDNSSLQETPGRTSKSKSKRPPSSDHFKGKPGGNKRAKSISSSQNLLFDKNKEHSSFNITQPNVTGRYEQHGSRDNEMHTSGTMDLDKGFQTDSWDSSPAMHAKNAASKIPRKVQHSPDFQDDSGLLIEHSKHGIGGLHSREKDLENANRLDNSYRRDYVEPGRMSMDNGQQWGKKSDVEKISSSVGKGSVLRREHSELELGELRETGIEEYQAVKRQADREGSLKSLQINIHPDNLDFGINKGRTANPTPELRKQSPITSKAASQRNDLNQRKQPKDSFLGPDRTATTQMKPMPSVNEQFDNMNHAGSMSMLAVDKTIERCRSDGRSSQALVLENNGSAHKKNSADILPQYDNMSVGEMVHKTTKEQKSRKSNLQRNSADRARNEVSIVNEIDDRRGRDSLSDEDNSLYLKYEKDKPELKGAIKDLSQYKEYVEEYREKYEVYCSLNKNLENIRNNFLQIGRDIEISKGRDMEEYFILVEKLKTMYQEYGEKNKKMKRVFLLLHDELKSLKQRIKDFAESTSND